MKGQAQVLVYGDGGELVTVLSGPTIDASFDIGDFVEKIGKLIYDFFASQTSLAKDAEDALRRLGGDVKADGNQTATFAQGGGLKNDVRLASYARIFFHAWTGDDIKPSFAGINPNVPGIADLGEVRYTRGDFQYEHRFILLFSTVSSGKYAFAFATGDIGTLQNATLAYTVEISLDPPSRPAISIQEKYDTMAQHGWFDFGPPQSDEIDLGTGRVRHWTNGSLFFSPGRGAHLVYGDIRRKYESLGWESRFGYPLSDESGCPDGDGRFNHFQGCSIYWTPAIGAHEINGAIREKWAALGWERSYLGYPITDEADDPNTPGGRYNNFEGGSIRWSPKTGPLDYQQKCPGT